MRKPWFRIIEVRNDGRLPLIEIARRVSRVTAVPIEEIRSQRRNSRQVLARHVFIAEARREHPEMTSGQIARFLGVTAWTVRRYMHEPIPDLRQAA